MFRLFLALIFLIPFQARFYKSLRSLSQSWLEGMQIPVYFESRADFFISDLVLLGLLGWALYRRKLDVRSLWSGDHKFLTVFLLFAGFSIVMSRYPAYLLSYWRWGHLVIVALTVYYLRAWIVQPFQKSFQIIAAVVAFSGAVESAIVLPQYFLQHEVGLKVVGEPIPIPPAHFDMPDGALTSVDYFLRTSDEAKVVLRATGTLPHPNVLGGFLAFSLLMTCFLYERSQRRLWVGAALILQLLALFTSYSRSGLFAFLGALLVWAILQLLAEGRVLKVWKPLVIGLTSALLLFFPQIFYRGGIVSYHAHNQVSDGMRITMQNLAAEMIRDHPWVGVGVNNYLLAFPHYAENESIHPIAVHNIYLLVAVETGLLGLGLFLLFCTVVIFRGWQSRHTLEGRTFLAIFLAFLAIGLVDYYPLVLQQSRLMFFLAAGLVLSSLPRVVRDEARHGIPETSTL